MTITTDATSPEVEEYGFNDLVKPSPMIFSGGELFFPEKEVNKAYLLVKERIQSYPYAMAEFDDTQHKFTLYHQEKEVQALITHLKIEKYFNLHAVSHLTSPNSMSFCARNVIFRVQESGFKEFIRRQEELLEHARLFYETCEHISVTIPEETFSKTSSIFSALLANVEGVCLGEYSHSHLASKAMLINHMEELYNLGVRTLYFEHAFYESMTKPLARELKIPEHIELYLQQLDSGNSVGSRNFTFLNTVKKALEVGIRVVPIDTSVSYGCGAHRKRGITSTDDRVKGMNFVATQIIEEEQKKVPGKYVALMGATHLCEYIEGVPGVSELLGVPSVLTEDASNGKLMCNVTTEIFHKPVSAYLQVKVSKVKRKRVLDSTFDSSPGNKKRKTR
jgi:hypothetical protein